MSCSNTAAACQGVPLAHRFLREPQAQLRDDESSVWIDVTITNMYRLADATGYLRARWMLEEAEQEAGEELRTTSWLQGTFACLSCMLGGSAAALRPCHCRQTGRSLACSGSSDARCLCLL